MSLRDSALAESWQSINQAKSKSNNEISKKCKIIDCFIIRSTYSSQ
ncbi:hypothetical protein [Helicobacter rodentium]|nr:hypothetical protein [Helicobacter rodentium]